MFTESLTGYLVGAFQTAEQFNSESRKYEEQQKEQKSQVTDLVSRERREEGKEDTRRLLSVN
jgi:hypothetical protein